MVGVRGTDFGLDQKGSKDAKTKSIYEEARERGITVQDVVMDRAMAQDWKEFEKDPQKSIAEDEKFLKERWAEYYKRAAEHDEKLRAQGKRPP